MSFVGTNLVHQQLWTQVEPFQVGQYECLRGVPPSKLHPEDKEITPEVVLVSHTEGKWTVRQWAELFHQLPEAKRVVMAMVTDDSTVVYYIVYRGLQVPRKN